jgi:hypothetical protein
MTGSIDGSGEELQAENSKEVLKQEPDVREQEGRR